MQNHTLKAIALAITFSFSHAALAADMSKADYQKGRDTISQQYNSASANCTPLSGNAKDICIAEAKGKEKIARAELSAAYQPSAKNSQAIHVARADANHDLALEKCDDMAGNAKDVCVKEAKAARTGAVADAKAQKTSAEARQEASEDKMDARYAVAREKCDSYSGSAKDSCLDKAKTQYTK